MIATGIAIQIAVGLTMHDDHPGYFFGITGSRIFIRMVIGIAMQMATRVVIAMVSGIGFQNDYLGYLCEMSILDSYSI